MWNKLAEACNIFAVSLHKKLAESGGNVVFSPYSLSVAFGMLYSGTKGTSAEEMKQVLGYNTAGFQMNEDVHENFREILKSFSNMPEGYALEIANSVLIQKDFPIRPEYVKHLKSFYQTEAKNVNFKEENEKVTADVNSWVKEQTKGKIENLLKSIDKSTALLLLNAVYFKGLWETPFKARDTCPIEFYNLGKESLKKQVDMMSLGGEEFPYVSLEEEQFSVLELPYKGGSFSMWVLLPNKMDGLSSMESKLSVDLLKKIESSLQKKKLNVLRLPKFKLEKAEELPPILQQMGMVGIFTRSELTGIAENLMVTQVVHKAFIEVNEEGAEAAAATAILIAPGCALFTKFVEFVADHPFLFLIIDKTSGMIMFSGRVTEL